MMTERRDERESIPSTKTIQVCTSNYPPHMHAMKLYLSNVPGLHVTSEPPQANSYIRYQETWLHVYRPEDSPKWCFLVSLVSRNFPVRILPLSIYLRAPCILTTYMRGWDTSYLLLLVRDWWPAKPWWGPMLTGLINVHQAKPHHPHLQTRSSLTRHPIEMYEHSFGFQARHIPNCEYPQFSCALDINFHWISIHFSIEILSRLAIETHL